MPAMKMYIVNKTIIFILCFATLFLYLFLGECYSGSDVEVAYNRDGPSNHCITRNFKECSAISLGNNGSQEDCVGAQGSNYVYRIIGMQQDQGSRREDYSRIRWRKKMANE